MNSSKLIKSEDKYYLSDEEKYEDINENSEEDELGEWYDKQRI